MTQPFPAPEKAPASARGPRLNAKAKHRLRNLVNSSSAAGGQFAFLMSQSSSSNSSSNSGTNNGNSHAAQASLQPSTPTPTPDQPQPQPQQQPQRCHHASSLAAASTTATAANSNAQQSRSSAAPSPSKASLFPYSTLPSSALASNASLKRTFQKYQKQLRQVQPSAPPMASSSPSPPQSQQQSVAVRATAAADQDRSASCHYRAAYAQQHAAQHSSRYLQGMGSRFSCDSLDELLRDDESLSSSWDSSTDGSQSDEEGASDFDSLSGDESVVSLNASNASSQPTRTASATKVPTTIRHAMQASSNSPPPLAVVQQTDYTAKAQLALMTSFYKARHGATARAASYGSGAHAHAHAHADAHAHAQATLYSYPSSISRSHALPAPPTTAQCPPTMSPPPSYRPGGFRLGQLKEDRCYDSDDTCSIEECALSISSCIPQIRQDSPLLAIGSDMLVSVVTFLEPGEILRLLTAPLSKEWRQQVTCHQDVWRTLCATKPFHALIPNSHELSDNDYSSDSDNSFCSLNSNKSKERYHPLGKYRLMYTSFIRCTRYLKRIQDNAKHGRPQSQIETGVGGTFFPRFGPSKSLKKFLARARNVIEQRQRESANERRRNSTTGNGAAGAGAGVPQPISISSDPIGVSDSMVSSLSSSGSSSSVASSPSVAAASGTDTDTDTDAHLAGKRTTADSSGPAQKKPRYGNSMITSRLLGPTAKNKPGLVNLPISCAIFSIVNWMVGFADVVGIQTMCIKTLPILLEDEQQRLTAQRYGVAEVILRAMVKFPDSVELHTAVFHTMVLLARPLGGREGMLYDNTMNGQSTHPLLTTARGAASTVRSHVPQAAAATTAAGARGADNAAARSSSAGAAASNGQQRQPPTFDSKGRIDIMLQSMQKFRSDANLQAMACWAMVNLALSPMIKSQIVLQGGIQATIAAMKQHPFHADVQFRGLFALINLVICSSRNPPPPGVGIGRGVQNAVSGASVGNPVKERAILDEQVETIAELVVTAMKNFCASETILNRACLVLHNMSQSPSFVHRLLWTPHCYQMLEWCITNYPTDSVLRRSAVTTLQRLQLLLSSDDNLRSRFASSLRAQQEMAIGRDRGTVASTLN